MELNDFIQILNTIIEEKANHRNNFTQNDFNRIEEKYNISETYSKQIKKLIDNISTNNNYENKENLKNILNNYKNIFEKMYIIYLNNNFRRI